MSKKVFPAITNMFFLRNTVAIGLALAATKLHHLHCAGLSRDQWEKASGYAEGPGFKKIVSSYGKVMFLRRNGMALLVGIFRKFTQRYALTQTCLEIQHAPKCSFLFAVRNRNLQ
jgi:hypothetical protein